MEGILWPYRESRKLQSTESDYRMRGQIDHPIDAHRPRFVHNRVLICNRDASECNNGRVCAYHSTQFTAEWSVRKTSIAWSSLDAEPQTSPLPMMRRKRDVGGMKLSLLTSHASVCNTPMVGFESGDTVERAVAVSTCVSQALGPLEPCPQRCLGCGGVRYATGREDTEQLRDAPSHWSCTGYHGVGWYWISFSHSSSTHCRYLKKPVEPVVLPYLQGLATAIFQDYNAQTHVARVLQKFFVHHQIELLLWPARSPDPSPIENMWSMVSQTDHLTETSAHGPQDPRSNIGTVGLGPYGLLRQ
ncbi:transposable element Tcb1 transposase [Trichonephila clavipes]|nr:transposable element Tcb1 transposase [Trichonephila clavipes]